MIEITKEDLKHKYYSMKNKELAKELNISEPTLTKIIESCGIPLKGKGKGGPGAIPKVRVI